MTCQTFKSAVLRNWIAYFSICCLLFTSHMPVRLFADPCSCILVQPEDEQRTRTATVVAGATIIALVGGIAYAAFGSSGRGHRHSSDSSSSSSSDSYYNHHHHHHHHPYSRHDSSSSSPWYSDYSPSHYYTSNPYSEFSKNNVSSFSGNGSRPFTDPQFLDRGSAPFFDRGNLPARCRTTIHYPGRRSKGSHQLSGTFIAHAHSLDRGSCTAFIQLPDGSTEVLGNISFSNAGSFLSYGPFTQKGTYAFGIRVDEGTQLSTQAKVELEINVNGSTTQSGEFLIPAHSCANYESHLHYFDFYSK